ncbi:MAG: hypothetical protein ACRYG8_46910 [Janthinobacterium lividum]
MANPVLTGLIRRRAELDGERIRLCNRVAEIALDLSRLDAAIGVFDREMNANTIRPMRVRAPNVVGFGHWSRTALDVLRGAGQSLPTKEVVARVMERVGADQESGPVRRMVAKRVRHALQHQRVKGLVRSDRGPGQVVVWEVV